MLYNNNNFGRMRDVLRISPYNDGFQEVHPSPPPGEFLLLDDSGFNLLDDSSDYLVSP